MYFTKQLRNGDFITKPFRLFSSYLPLNFMLQFKKGKSYLKIANPTSKGLTIKTGTALGCDSFELIHDLSECSNTITHLHQDMHCSHGISNLSMLACPIHHPLVVDPDITHFCTCQTPYNHTPQSHDYPSCAESLHLPKGNVHHNYHSDAHNCDFNDNQHELILIKCIILV